METLILLCSIISLVLSQDIGDDCRLRTNAKSMERISGKCTLLKECPEVIAGLKRGKYPHICSFRGLEAIVCCPTMPKITDRILQTDQKPENHNRISKQKCVEYGKSVYKNKTILTMDGSHHVNVSTCAINTQSFVEDSIYAKEREFPHMALVGLGPSNMKRWVCSGSLISEKFVLTVAHCTSTRSGEVQWVRLGDLDFESPNDDSVFLDVSILEIHRHPRYRPPVIYNDIALLELHEPVPFSEYIRPACLHAGREVTADRLTVAGWALAHGPAENRGHLRQNKNIRRVGNDKCNEAFKNLVGRRLKDGIVDEMMVCTEDATNDACQISSGTALHTYNNDVYCMYDIIGITSFGTGFCGSNPVVYTRVSTYINWIEAIVWPQVIHMM